MYKEKGHIKVFNGKKYKIVSYQNNKGLITFATSSKSHKFAEISKNHKIKVNFSGRVKNYLVKIIEDPEKVDVIFKELKKKKVIPFFIPRKNKVIIQYHS